MAKKELGGTNLLEHMIFSDLKLAMERATYAASERARQNTRIAKAIASERFVQSIQPTAPGESQAFVTESVASLMGIVIATAPYSKDLEEGMMPGQQVAPEDIMKWMQLKDIRPFKGMSKRKAAGNIARSLTKKGYEGRHMFRDTARSIEPFILELFRQSVKR